MEIDAKTKNLLDVNTKYYTLVNYLKTILEQKQDSMYIERNQIELILKALKEVE